MSASPIEIIFQCHQCGQPHDVVALAQGDNFLDRCCRTGLFEVTRRFNSAVMKQAALTIHTEAPSFNDALADAAILSPNAEVRAAAIRYRNEKNRDGG